MKHAKKTEFLNALKKLWKHYRMGEIEIYGEPWRISKAMELRDKASYAWKSFCDESGNFNVTVRIPSQSRFKFTSYEIRFKVKQEEE